MIMVSEPQATIVESVGNLDSERAHFETTLAQQTHHLNVIAEVQSPKALENENELMA